MHKLPLFLDVVTPIEREPSVNVSRDCTRCGFAALTKSPRCAPADAQVGGILVVGAVPSRVEAAGGGRPFSDQNGAAIRKIVASVWSGPVGYANAVLCDVGYLKNRGPAELMAAVAACRGHLAAVVRAVKPTRIIITHPIAATSILGRPIQPLQSRKAYAYLADGTPVFVVLTPQHAGGNRFMRAMAEDDFRWAATAEPLPPAWGGVAHIVETRAQAESVAAYLRAEWARGLPIAWDVETAGRMWTAGFRLTAVGLTPAGSDDAYVLTREACADPIIREPIAALLADPAVGKGGANVKYDVNAIENAWGVETLGTIFDTRLWRKLAEPDMPANLAVMAESVGYGGHKAEAKAAEDAVMQRVRARFKWENQPFTNLGKIKEEPPTLAALGLDPALEKLARSDKSPKSFLFGVIDRDVLHRYNARDCVTTGKLALMYRKRLHGTPQGRVWGQVVRRANDAMTKVERWGIGVDVERIHAFDKLCQRKAAEHRELFAQEAPGVDPAKNEEVKHWLYHTLGLPVLATTQKTGEPSTGRTTLEKLTRYAPAVDTLLWIRKYEKLRSTYAAGMLPHVRDDGRIHPSFLLDGAATGRTSCVIASTPLRTSEGTKAIVDVVPGDFVWTHRERWRRVLASFPNGVRPTYALTFSNGNVLTCTDNHRLLDTAGRWVFVREILDEHFNSVGAGRGEQESGARSLPVRGCFDDERDRGADEHAPDQRAAHLEGVYAVGRAEGPRVRALLGIEDGEQKSYDREARGGAPQLDRDVRGRPRLPYDPARGHASVCAPGGDGTGVGSADVARLVRCAPHRRGPKEQPARQPGARDAGRASHHSFFAGEGLGAIFVAKIEACGRRPVFDITVDEDESYESLGVFSHNCVGPNLQNIPRAKHKNAEWQVFLQMARSVFCAPKGRALVQLDYSQVELRVAVMLSRDPVMRAIFDEGVDFHRRTAELIAPTAWGIDPSQVGDAHRTDAKSVNFGILFGKTARTFAREFNISLAKAQAIVSAIFGAFPRLEEWSGAQRIAVEKDGGVWTYWNGERARFRPLWQIGGPDDGKRSTAVNSAVNTPIQGSASEFCISSIADMVEWIERDKYDAKVVLPVHDSIMLECRAEDVDEVIHIGRGYMVAQPAEGMPLVVDAETGPEWGALKKYTGPILG